MSQITKLPKGTPILTTPSVSNVATLILAANPNRKLAVLTNPSTTTTVYFGPAGVTTTNYTMALPGTPVGSSYIDGDSNAAWYAIVSSGTQTMNITEIA